MDDAAVEGVEPSGWVEITRENPGHSSWYVERFRTMAAAGDDLAGEARLVDAMVARGARILDAGCGPGRVGSALARVGHEVVGVDVDPVLIAAANEDHPGPRWLVGDLAELDLPAHSLPSWRGTSATASRPCTSDSTAVTRVAPLVATRASQSPCGPRRRLSGCGTFASCGFGGDSVEQVVDELGSDR